MISFSSSSIVDSRTVGTDIDNHFLTLGSAVMVRKFDPTVVISGSWIEGWIGLRCRVNHYNYTSSKIQNGWYKGCDVAVGFCKYPGAVYGESGSLNFSNSNTSHSMYAFMQGGIRLSVGDNYWSRMNYSASHQRVIGSLFGVCDVTGSKSLTGGLNWATSFNITENPKNRDIIIFRFYTASVSTWNVSCLRGSASFNDMSSSTILADLMESTTWNIAKTSGSAFGMLQPTASNTNMTVNQTVNGYFDSIFMEWPMKYDTFEVNDVVCKFF